MFTNNQYIIRKGKVPVDWRTMKAGNAYDPAIWLSHESATAMATALGMSVGFVFTKDDPYWFLDIDDCLVEGKWSDTAQYFCQMFAGAAIEVSTSGTGLHIFGRGIPPEHRTRNSQYHLEFYSHNRSVLLTGNGWMGSVEWDGSHLLPWLVENFFKPDDSPGTGIIDADWTDGPCEDWVGPEDDDELIRRALHSKSAFNAFGGKATFAQLWEGDVEALGRAFPDSERPYDCSKADSALAQQLSFWTGADCERIRRLMYRSALVRAKWERADYLPRTIKGVVRRQGQVYRDPKIVNEREGAVVTSVPSGFSEFLTPADQVRFFAGCTYIVSLHKALCANGSMLKPEQFNVVYGGHRFCLDERSEKLTNKAWDAFTNNPSMVIVKVDKPIFKPAMPPGAIIERGGVRYVNTYYPVEVARMQGDPGPFLTHLHKVLPVQGDRDIFMAYMASCVQNQGKKFGWAPLLQGVEGNGKTLFSRCVAKAIGDKYTYWPRAHQLNSRFNGWLVDKIFCAIEDVKVHEHQTEIVEILKPMIAGGDGLEIEDKSISATTADICANFMFNSNHRDAIPTHKNDRRFCVLYSAQQCSDDLKRDGMDGDYFPNLYDWLNNDGFAIVADYLSNYKIPKGLDPAGECHRAPTSSSTSSAIALSLGRIEQEIMEAVEQDKEGFRGGWISSIKLGELIRDRVSYSKRKEILHNLGYITHPALPDGRSGKKTIIDNGKPRLYIHKNAPSKMITDGAMAVAEYEMSNSPFTR